MATPSQCPEYEKCGFVEWRKQRPDGHMTPLPEDGDCGISAETCGRRNPAIPINPITPGPYFRSEIDITFPTIDNKNNRPKKRLVGGGFQD